MKAVLCCLTSTPLNMVRASNILKAVEICRKYGSHKVLLFGSAARKPVTEANDIDIVCYGVYERRARSNLFFDLSYLDDPVDITFDDDVDTHVLRDWEAYGQVFLTEPTPAPIAPVSVQFAPQHVI